MQVGEIVTYQESTWRVYRMDRQVRTSILMAWDGTQAEVPDDSPDVKLVCNPSQEWCLVMAPLKSERDGKLVRLVRPSRNGSTELRPLQDWMPSDPLRPGGALFLNPKLRMQQGEILSVEHQNGSRSRVVISAKYGTVQQRKVHKPISPVRPTIYDLIESGMGEDDDT